MKKTLILASMAALALVGCSKNGMEVPESNMQEMSILPMIGNAAATRGYTTGTAFMYGKKEAPLVEVGYRTMQLSAYLYPQDGEQGNYFVNTTYAIGGDGLWHAQPNPIYWPIGGTMDFLAFSMSEEKNVNVVWNEDNAASQVVLSVPGENTQNDILFASAAGVKSTVTGGTAGSKGTVDMTFDHAQAWLQFNLTSTEPAGNVVKFKRIVLEDVYNAGELTISNNGGEATAVWDFSGAAKQDIAVDDIQKVSDKYLKPASTSEIYYGQQLNMLIPQQKKTTFVIYYTLGTDTQELSYRFDTDLKTWLMGEKYIYNICLNTSEVTVSPKVTKWDEITELNVTVE